MSIDQYALAKMALESLLLGVLLELVFELLRFAIGIFLPRLLNDVNEKNDDVGAVICISVRDFIFLTFCGIAFSVFVYYTNDGSIRFIAVAGTIVGFTACYFSLGRFIRRCSVLALKLIYKLIGFLLLPIRLLVKYVVECIQKGCRNIGALNRKKYTLRETKKISIIKKCGIP